MGVASKAGDWAFKAFTAGLGVATVYLGATFSVNVYRGLKWHNSQAIVDKESSNGDDRTKERQV
ncbi:hypothetical protein DM860_005574 [Cuscuta australis]|uniref:Uncharacterized protein n=1 Tax=Cuscuta australis TaxID=267555 RepID=A0A328DS97_9ASTE|nr:hypothetical protein DM860_005574 [Cuscuta australis]